MYKIAICDDNLSYIQYLKEIIIKTNLIVANNIHFMEFLSGEQMLLNEEQDYDLVIMDVEMAEMDGYETAMSLRHLNNNFLLVFCSGIVRPETRFFKANTFRYLLKNISQEEMYLEMNEILMEIIRRKSRPHLICRCGSGRMDIKVYSNCILYVAIHNAGCEVYVSDKLKEMYHTNVLRTNMKLEAVTKILTEGYGFVRIHNSYIVNVMHIIDWTSHNIRLVDDTILSIARSKEKNFKKVFSEFMGDKY